MKRSVTCTLVAVLGLGLTAGAAFAQAPDVEEGQPQPARPQRAPIMIGGPDALLTIVGAEVAVANVDAGVELTITALDGQPVDELQKRVTQTVESLQRMIERMREQQAQGGRQWAMRGAGLWGIIWGGKAELAAAPIDKGMVVSITSDDADVVKELHDNMPEWIDAAKERRKQMEEARRRMAVQMQVNRLIAEGKMKIELVPTDDGLTVKFTSDDPQTAEQIKKLLPDYIESLKAQPSYVRPIVQRRVRRGPDGREEREIDIRFPPPPDGPPPPNPGGAPPPDNP